MLGKDDDVVPDGGGDNGGSSSGPCPAPLPRKTYWRSASWSTSRTMLEPLNQDGDEKDTSGLNGNNGGRCRFSVPLTPKSHGNSKARSLLPPLQPLAISRRSLDEWPKAGSDDVGEWPLPCTPGGRDLSNSGERLKLDLSSIRSDPDKSSGLVKKDKIAFYDKECSKVEEHLYLGGDAVARDRGILKKHNITHILNCVGFVCPEYFKSDFVYRTLWLQDSPSEDITSILYDVFDYFEDVREQQGRVFVHCCQGVSRSTSLVIAYRMWREGQSFDDAFQYVKAARSIADPNMGFACQLIQCQKRVHAFPLSPSSLLRMYRIASHSSYDPLHLVPKLLNSPTPAALDSRGAFIVHIPSAIYIWIGKKCGAVMERDARAAVCQIARYEKLQGPIVAIKEGEEPSYFWDVFSDLLPIMDKHSKGLDVVESSKNTFPGDRQVSSYDVEYEIFPKAIVGGYVPPSASSDSEHETHLPVRESSWSALRRKFTPGSMKEFVSASKSSPSRVYPDSMLKHCAENTLSKPSLSHANISSSLTSLSPPSISSSSSSTVSSSSSSYLSPNSISSDRSISSKYCSDSSLESPSTFTFGNSLSCNAPSFSSLSLQSCKLSPQSISKSAEFIAVSFEAGHCPQSIPHSERPPLSISERRGSMAKSIKLPILTNESRETDAPPSNDVASENVCLRTKNDKCSPDGHNAELEPTGEGELMAEPTSQGTPHRINFIQQAAFDKTSDKSRGSELPEVKSSTVFLGMVERNLACPKTNQLVVCKWPSLEKIEKFGAGDLNSEDAFVLVAPASEKLIEHRVLYIWVGKGCSFGKGNMLLRTDQDIGELEKINWNKVSSDVVTQMGLSKDTDVKIVKEEEEPEDFLALLSSL